MFLKARMRLTYIFTLLNFKSIEKHASEPVSTYYNFHKYKHILSGISKFILTPVKVILRYRFALKFLVNSYHTRCTASFPFFNVIINIAI